MALLNQPQIVGPYRQKVLNFVDPMSKKLLFSLRNSVTAWFTVTPGQELAKLFTVDGLMHAGEREGSIVSEPPGVFYVT